MNTNDYIPDHDTRVRERKAKRDKDIAAFKAKVVRALQERIERDEEVIMETVDFIDLIHDIEQDWFILNSFSGEVVMTFEEVLGEMCPHRLAPDKGTWGAAAVETALATTSHHGLCGVVIGTKGVEAVYFQHLNPAVHFRLALV